MGPLVPMLPFSLALFILAWLFRDSMIVAGVPVFTGLCGLLACGIVIHYLWHFSKFARNEPDRLQSEQYQIQVKQMQTVSAKSLSEPLAPDMLNEPSENLSASTNDGVSSEQDVEDRT